MEKYLPSNIFIAVAASALFIVGGGYLVFFVGGSRQQAEGEIIQHSMSAERRSLNVGSEIANKDTDGDGLKDWEEVLWHTDANNPDTDGDGMGDNEEILAKRDPTVKGKGLPSKASAKVGKIDAPGASILIESETLTGSMAQQFGEAYLRQKFGKKNVDSAYLSKTLFSEISDTLVAQSYKPVEEYISAKEFSVISDSSPKALHTYLNELGNVFSQTPSSIDKDALEMSSQALLEERFEDFKKLLVHRDAYRFLADNIKIIKVPAVMAEAHYEMVNSFWRLGLIAEQMSRFEEDPLGSMVAFNLYLIEAKRSIEPLKRIVQAIKANNLVFQEDEGGSVFNKYLSIL